MASSSSSTKRAARLAQKGRRQRVRFQGGTLFPTVIAAVLVIGVLLVIYARQSVPKHSNTSPSIDDHWHMAYGFQICSADNFVQLQGNKETPTDSFFQQYAATGVHSHDDGVIHWHAFTSAAVGDRAVLGVFLDTYGVELTNDSLKFPDDQNGGKEYVSGETKCGDETGHLEVHVWDHYNDTGDGTVYVSDFDQIRLQDDGIALTIAFVPDGVDVVKPPWSADLPRLGAIDAGTNAPGPGAEGPSVTATAGTATDDTATDGTATNDTATNDTATAATEATEAPSATEAVATTAG